MKTLIIPFLFLISFNVLSVPENEKNNSNFITESSPQKTYSRYQQNFDYHHDRGFYLSAMLGPRWNQSIRSPEAKGLRFGGKLAVGYYLFDGIAPYIALWGNFLEEASLVAIGPGIEFLLNKPNLGFDFSFGIGKVFNPVTKKEHKNFLETVLSFDVAVKKYWWLSKNTSIGAALNAGLHGITLFQGRIGSVGFNLGASLVFLFG